MIYAIGDIHGRNDLLTQLLVHIRDHHNFFGDSDTPEIICIGDYIDGGPDSREVIDTLMRGTDKFHLTCLMGNHEALMLDCLDTDDRQAWHNWLSNGGETTLNSFDVSMRFGGYDPRPLRSALGPDRIDWLKNLRICETRGRYLFVHAGIAPGVPLGEQTTEDMLWIRSRFLDSAIDHGHIVVHGHTPDDEPVVRTNRICIDTGATSNSVLTAAVLSQITPPSFLRATTA